MEENYKRILTSDRVLTNEELTELGVTSINEDRYLFDDALYNARVLTAGGTIPYPDNVQEFFRDLPPDIDTDDIKLLFMADGGCIINTDQYNSYSKGFSLFKTIDFGQNTRINQPRLVGGIAPNSKVVASNQNGESRFFTHPEISFAAGEAWSITTVLSYSELADNRGIYGGTTNPFSVRQYLTNGILRIFYAATNLITTVSVKDYIDKAVILTITYNNGTLSIFINGVLKQTASLSFAISLNTLGAINPSGTVPQPARYYSHIIQSSALTAPQVTSLHTFLRTKYPEIESTVIGTQEWSTRNFEAVATPVGNVIPNVTVNGAVEKITNAADREFSSDTGFWTKYSGATIADGVVHIINKDTGISIERNLSLPNNKWYKATITVSNYVSGAVAIYGNGKYSPNYTANGTYICYFKSDYPVIFYYSLGITTLDIDNVSIQELNWSNATEIYDAVYAARIAAGDNETQAEYAALKEAAMWCYYNNDAANGAIYGKLYNWYAAKLLDLDMASTSFGWRVPTSAQFTTLTNALGGAAVAGGKMKMTGTDYWNTPNTGATNESGFTALGGGLRSGVTANFVNIKDGTRFWQMTNLQYVVINHNTETFSFPSDQPPVAGATIRLIKV